MLVSDFKEQEGYLFEEDTLILIPNKCSSCGNELEINPSLTHLSCTNPRCIDKVTLRTVAMLDQLGVVDIGEPTIKKLVNAFGIESPLVFFMYEPEDWESVDEDLYSDALKRKADALYAQLDSKRGMTLIEFVKYANLPNVQTSADKLFEGVSSLEEFYEELELNGDTYIQDKLGIQAEISIRSSKLYLTFMEFKEDLFEVYDSGFVSILEDDRADVRINAVCTDEVGGGFRRKSDFYTYIEENYKNKIHIDWGKSATKSMDVLIWAGADGTSARYTNKVKKTETWNEKGSDIPILTAQEFLEIINNSIDGQSVLDTLEGM